MKNNDFNSEMGEKFSITLFFTHNFKNCRVLLQYLEKFYPNDTFILCNFSNLLMYSYVDFYWVLQNI